MPALWCFGRTGRPWSGLWNGSQLEGHYSVGMLLEAGENASGCDHDEILFTVEFVGRRWSASSGGQFVGPQFISRDRIQGPDFAIDRTGGENQAASGHDQPTEIGLTGEWHTSRREFRVFAEGPRPKFAAGIQINRADQPPRGVRAWSALVVKEQLPGMDHFERPPFIADLVRGGEIAGDGRKIRRVDGFDASDAFVRSLKPVLPGQIPVCGETDPTKDGNSPWIKVMLTTSGPAPTPSSGESLSRSNCHLPATR